LAADEHEQGREQQKLSRNTTGPNPFGSDLRLEQKCTSFHLQHISSAKRFILTLQLYKAIVGRLLTPARTFAVVAAKF
jgi:hypothetical protein